MSEPTTIDDRQFVFNRLKQSYIKIYGPAGLDKFRQDRDSINAMIDESDRKKAEES